MDESSFINIAMQIFGGSGKWWIIPIPTMLMGRRGTLIRLAMCIFTVHFTSNPDEEWPLPADHMSRIAWWRHQMETFSALLTICAGICVWINGWVNNREAGDLRRHRGHYDVNVMVRSHRFESADQILERVLGYCVWKINYYHGRCRFFL